MISVTWADRVHVWSRAIPNIERVWSLLIVLESPPRRAMVKSTSNICDTSSSRVWIILPTTYSRVTLFGSSKSGSNKAIWSSSPWTRTCTSWGTRLGSYWLPMSTNWIWLIFHMVAGKERSQTLQRWLTPYIWCVDIHLTGDWRVQNAIIWWKCWWSSNYDLWYINTITHCQVWA